MFDYLLDGVIEYEVLGWRERLKDAPDEVLSLCERAVGKASASVAEEALREANASCGKALERLQTQVKQQISRIPIPKSIFVGETERKPAYAAICRLLCGIEDAMREVRMASLAYFEVEDLLSARACKHNDAVRMLSNVRAAAREEHLPTPLWDLLEALTARLSLEGERAERIANDQKEIGGRVRELLEVTLPDFCTRMQPIADFAHEGAACNPMAALRLCGEWNAVLEQLVVDIR